MKVIVKKGDDHGGISGLFVEMVQGDVGLVIRRSNGRPKGGYKHPTATRLLYPIATKHENRTTRSKNGDRPRSACGAAERA